MAESDIRRYQAKAASTDTFGRVLCSVRQHRYLIDGPVQNGCPGEEVTPGELFLSAVASCGVELVQVIAKDDGIPVRSIEVTIHGEMNRSSPVRRDVSLFNSVLLHFLISGATEDDAQLLVGREGDTLLRVCR